MAITNQHRKHLKSIAHHLQPVVTIAGNGLSDSVLNELERALTDHELIKIRIMADDRDERAGLIDKMAQLTHSDIVQAIGKTAVLLRKNAQPNPKLSNLIKHQSGR